MHSVPISFCRLDSDYLSQIIYLEQQSFKCPWSEDQFMSAFEQGVFAVFGLLQAKKLLAYISGYYICTDMEVLNIAVRKDLRHRGLGHSLLSQTLHIAKKWGMLQATLEVRKSNIAALRLYTSLGFQLTGQRKGYYPDTGEDALVYNLDLNLMETPCKNS